MALVISRHAACAELKSLGGSLVAAAELQAKGGENRARQNHACRKIVAYSSDDNEAREHLLVLMSTSIYASRSCTWTPSFRCSCKNGKSEHVRCVK